MTNTKMCRLAPLALISLIAIPAFGAEPSAVRIEGAFTALPQSTVAWASAQNDTGPVEGDLRLTHLTILLKRAPDRQQAFEEFLRQQQDPASPNFHRWINAAQIGDWFGVPAPDIAAVASWLESQGLKVDQVSNSRTRIRFSGTAEKVGAAFGAPLHKYMVAGEQWISISDTPRIPAALADIVQSVHGLHTVKDVSYARIASDGVASVDSDGDKYTNCTVTPCSHRIFPGDFAAIYNVNPVYQQGIDGSGQSIAILGRSRVYMPDIENFQARARLATKDPVTIIPPAGTDPGTPAGPGTTLPADQGEATLDVTRAGSVAPGATIKLIVSLSTSTVSGIQIAAEYAVDTIPAPAQIISVSFGACELNRSTSGVLLYDSIFGEAAAEGTSVLVASGDAGAAGCDKYFDPPPAAQALSPNYLCSSSFVTCVGGTQFNDVANPDAYWATTNVTGFASALGYIPEGAWNEPLDSTGASQAAGTGGGVSSLIQTPDWQKGTGVPSARSGRYTPDVSFSAAGHDPYFNCSAAKGRGCDVVNGSFSFITNSGTSAAAPDMAGIVALLNQRMGEAQGQLNPRLYTLAASPANGVFHDVTVASSGVVACDISTPSLCNNSTAGPAGVSGGLAGYAVGSGYDLATGLGSINVSNLLAQWPSVLPASAKYQGLWWAMPGGSESGWGINFAHQGDTIFASWFTYDLSGAGSWLVMTAPKIGGSTYAGTLYATSGPPFNATPFNPSLVASTAVGTGVLTFSGLNDGVFVYQVGSTSQLKAITRQVFGPVPTCATATTNLSTATNYTDLWWASPASSESGWGINLTHSGTNIFASWFTYDTSGKAMWLVVTAPRTGTNVFSGTLYRTTGPAFNTVPFNPSSVVSTPVGTATFTFANGNSAQFAYNVNGISQTKTITRELFGATGTICQ